MKLSSKRILSVITALATAAASIGLQPGTLSAIPEFSASAGAFDLIDNPPDVMGNCGKAPNTSGVNWFFSGNMLEISGSGEMADYSASSDQPWQKHSGSIKTVTIGLGVTSIGQHAFSSRANITSVSIPDTVGTIGANAFNGCTGLGSVTIPASVTTIGEGAFYNSCVGSVTFAQGTKISSIGKNALAGASDIRFYGTAAQWNAVTKGDNAVSTSCKVHFIQTGSCGATQNDSLTWTLTDEDMNGVPDTLTITGSGAMTDWSDYDKTPWAGCKASITSIALPDGLTHIGKYAFYGTAVIGIKLPDGLLSVGEKAFGACEALESISLPGGVTVLEEGTFDGCKKLSSVSLSDNTSQIGKSAFSGCAALTGIKLPESLTALGAEAFYGSGLKKIELPDSLNTFKLDDTGKNSAFGKCSSLESVTLPSTITEIPAGFFEDCTSLEGLTLPESVTKIGGYAFCNSGITSLKLPEDLSSIDEGAFCGTSITSVTIPDSVTGLGVDETGCANTFAGCKELKSAVIGSGINTVPVGMFSDCEALESVTIPESVTKIGEGSFGKYESWNEKDQKAVYSPLQKLGTIFFLGAKTQWDSMTISESSGLSTENTTFFCTDSSFGKEISAENLTVGAIADQIYTGKALTPAPTVSYNGFALAEDGHYTVEYSDNTNVGTAYAAVKGRDSIKGEKTVSFAIGATTVSDPTISPDSTYDLTYSASEKKPPVTVTAGQTEIPSSEYTVSYKNNKNAGTATVIITDKPGGNYTVNGSKTFVINRAPASVSAKALSKAYGEKDPALTADVSGVFSGDTINYTLSRKAGEDIGEYAITVNLGDNPNYDVKAADSKLTVSQAEYKGTKTAAGSTMFGKTGEADLSAIVCDGGVLGTLSANSELFDGKPSVSGKKLSYKFANVKENVGKKATVTIPVTSVNYKDYTIIIELTVSACEHGSVTLKGQRNADCRNGGYTGDYVCDYCGDTVKTGTVVSANGHTPGELVGAKAATCTEDGYSGDRFCTVCGEKTETGKIITANGHTPGELVGAKAATCTEDGYTGDHFCTVCGEMAETGKIITANGHTPGELTGVKAVTCTKDGYTGDRFCTVCKEKLETGEKITAKGHIPGELTGVKAVTCTKDGYTGDRFCTVCSAQLETGRTIPATGHTASPAVKENEKAATCLEAGSYDEVVYCSVCGGEISREKKTEAKLSHKAGKSVSENIEGNICLVGGSYDKVVYCELCGGELSREHIVTEKPGHIAGDPVKENEKEPDCISVGGCDEVVYCVNCGAEMSRVHKVMPRLGHIAGEPVRENVTQADCSEGGGYEEIVCCETCGAELSRKNIKIPKLGHEFKDLVCERCGIGEYNAVEVKEPDKTVYLTGEELDLTGAQLRLIFFDNSQEDIALTADMVSGFDTETPGIQTVTASYAGYTDSFEVIVEQPLEPKKPVKSIKIITKPSGKNNLKEGGKLDLTNGKLAVLYTDGEEEIIDLAYYMISGYDSHLLGKQELIVRYGGAETKLDVRVNELKIKTLSIAELPAKTVYRVGEELDLTGGLLYAEYNSGQTETVSMLSEDVTVRGFKSSKVDKSVTVKIDYGGKHVKYEIKVVEDTDKLNIRVGTKRYGTIDDAIDDIKEPGSYEIRVTEDHTEDKTITTPQNIEGVKLTLTVEEGKTLSIKGFTSVGDVTLNGHIKADSLNISLRSGTLTINSDITADKLKICGKAGTSLILGSNLTAYTVASISRLDTGAATLTVIDDAKKIGRFDGSMMMIGKTTKKGTQKGNLGIDTIGKANITIPMSSDFTKNIDCIDESLTLTVEGDIENGDFALSCDGKQLDPEKITIIATQSGERFGAVLIKSSVYAMREAEVTLNGMLFPTFDLALNYLQETKYNGDAVITLNKDGLEFSENISKTLSSFTIRSEKPVTLYYTKPSCLKRNFPLIFENINLVSPDGIFRLGGASSKLINCTINGTVDVNKLVVNGIVTITSIVKIKEIGSETEGTKLILDAEIMIISDGISQGSKPITLLFPGKTFKAGDKVIKKFKGNFDPALLKLDEANGKGELSLEKSTIILK